MTFAARQSGHGSFDGPVALVTVSTSHFTIDPLNATSGIRYNSDGTIDERKGAAYTATGSNWYFPTTTGIGSSYFIHHSVVTGDALNTDTMGTAGTTDLSVAREVRITTTTNQTKISSFSINITPASGTTPIVSSAICEMTAERSI